MLTLALIFCLASDPTQCQTIHPDNLDAQASPMACMIQAQQLAAQWLDEHPKWKLQHYECTMGKKDQPA